MQKESLSIFHEHFLLFLQNDLQQKKKSEGWDERLDPEVRSYRDLLSRLIRGQEPLKLQEIVDKYHTLFDKRGPVHLEHKILEAFPEQEMKKLGFSPLRIIRGLPRVFCKNAPVLSSKIHPAFTYLPSLKRAALAKPLYSMYKDQALPKDAKMAISAAGSTDRLLAAEIAHQMKQMFPDLDIRINPEKGDLAEADLWMQLSGVEAEVGQPIVEKISWRGPSNGAMHSMGLHFLDCGIFLRSFRQARWTEEPGAFGDLEIEKGKRFFFSSLKSPTGVFVYLHALFKSLEWDDKEIDLCVPDPKPFIDYFQARLADNRPVLEKSYGLSEISFSWGSQTNRIEISPTGKKVHIFSPVSLSDAELRRFLLLSGDFAGVSGNDGFTDAVAANKGFFYDPATLTPSLVKDLIALAENRISAHRSTVGILRLFTKLYGQQVKLKDGDWVDEISIQCEEKAPLLEIAEKIGIYLQDPDALAGFKKLNRIIAKDYSCNAFFFHMLQRAVCHKRRPQAALIEEEAVSKFISSQISLSQLVQHLQDVLL